MWFEIYDAWGNKYLLERFTYQQARTFCDKNEPPVSLQMMGKERLSVDNQHDKGLQTWIAQNLNSK